MKAIPVVLAAFILVLSLPLASSQPQGLASVSSSGGEVLIPPGAYYAIKVDPSTGEVTPMPVREPQLPAVAVEALNRVPDWIRPLLERQFHLLMQDYMVLSGNSRPAVGDVNGDGLPDLVVGSSDGKVHIFLNVGWAVSPIFEELQTLDVASIYGEATGGLVTPALADADGDGLVDIVIGIGDGTVHLFRNTGTETNPVWEVDEAYFSGVSVAGNATPFMHDMDGDGVLDLVVGDSDGVVHCFINEGSPAAPSWWEDPEYFPVWIEDWWDGRGPHYEGVWAGNNSRPVLMVHDGTLYLLLGVDDGSVHVFRSAGSTGYPAWSELGALEDIQVSNLASPWVADLDGDGVPDLVLGSSDGGIYFVKSFGEPLGFRPWPSGAENYLLANWFWGPAYYPTMDLLRVTGLNTEIVEHYANVILGVEDQYVDEVAYAIAVERPMNLVMFYYNGGWSLYELNAESIYDIAEQLPYVRVSEHGDYTTLAYRTEDGWEELPREVYYKYLVTFSRYIVAWWAWPSRYDGNFFRTYLPYNDTYGVRLIDRVSEAETLRDAAYLVDYWLRVDIGAVWHPGPRGKPPGWYNIYLHLTDENYSILCGEFSIIYEVSARAVLIPTINVVDIAEDHQFNNFWYRGSWHHVDSSSGSPGENGTWAEYFDPPRGLAGWYRNTGFSYPIEWEENGMYDPPWRSEVPYAPEGMLANLTFRVVDASGRPVDGARVEVWSHWTIESGYDTAPYIAGLYFTDQEGIARFPMLGLGRTHNFTVVVTSRIGSTMFKVYLDHGGDYSFTVRIPNRLPEVPGPLEIPAGSSKHYVSASIRVLGAEQNPPDWIHILYVYFDYKYYVEFPEGKVDVYVIPEDEFENFLHFGEFGSLASFEWTGSADVGPVPVDGPVYVVISNRHSITTFVKVQFDVDLLVDSEAPTVVITSPEDGALIASSTVTVTFDSAATDVDHFEMSVDGSEYFEVASPYTITGLGDGTHVISVRAVDVSGNVGPPATITITIDTTAPVISVLTPGDGQMFTEREITVEGTITGAVAAYLNGEPLELDENGNFSTTVELSEGMNTLTITAVDEAGNEARLTIRVYYYPDIATKEDISAAEEAISHDLSTKTQEIQSSIDQLKGILVDYVNQTSTGILEKIDALNGRMGKIAAISVVTLILVIVALIAVFAKK